MHSQNKEDVTAAAGKCMQEEKNARIKTPNAEIVACLVTFPPFVENWPTSQLQDPNQEINQDISRETNQDINQEINRDPHHQLWTKLG